jgi:hypothetical protein
VVGVGLRKLISCLIRARPLVTAAISAPILGLSQSPILLHDLLPLRACQVDAVLVFRVAFAIINPAAGIRDGGAVRGAVVRVGRPSIGRVATVLHLLQTIALLGVARGRGDPVEIRVGTDLLRAAADRAGTVGRGRRDEGDEESDADQRREKEASSENHSASDSFLFEVMLKKEKPSPWCNHFRPRAPAYSGQCKFLSAGTSIGRIGG